MAILTARGTVSYNGYTFGPETETVGVDIRPILDTARRTVIANQYTFKIKSIIAVTTASGDTSNDDDLEDIRTALTASGCQFRYQSKGLGDIKINVSGGQRDMVWGPIPEVLTWKPIAGDYAAEIVWQVSYQTLDCNGAQFRFGIMAFNYTVEFEQGHDRLTNRNVTGYLQIPQTRSAPGSKTLSDSADNYYDNIVPEIPLGFRRESERRKINENKNRLDFSFRDTMLKEPLLPGLIDMDVRHTQQNNPKVQFWVKTGVISFSCEVALHFNMNVAQVYFEEIVRAKFELMVNENHLVIPWIYTANEDTQKRQANFTVTYKVVRNPAFPAILGPVGFWRRVPMPAAFGFGNFADHQAWAASMIPANIGRGYTQENVGEDQDAIIDMCFESPGQIVKPNAAPVGRQGGDVGQIFQPGVPDPGSSWLWWECDVIIGVDDGIIAHRPLPRVPQPNPNNGRPSLVDVFNNPNGHLPVQPGDFTPDGNKSVKAQRRAKPIVYVWLVGYAIRIGYQIPAPSLLLYCGQPVYPANRAGREYYVTGQIGNCGVGIFWAAWRIRFIVLDTPQAPAQAVEGPLFPLDPTTLTTAQGPDEGTGE